MSAAEGGSHINHGPGAVERAAELLADRAMLGLSEAEQAELQHIGLTTRSPFGGTECAPDGFSTFDLAAAAADLAMFGVSAHPMPSRVRQALELAADRFIADQLTAGRNAQNTSSSQGLKLTASEPNNRGGTRTSPFVMAGGLGWLAAAAGITLAAVAWWPRLTNTGDSPLPNRPSVVTSEVEQIESALASAQDVVRATWLPWELNGEGPECQGVTGEVIWSDASQSGVMKFTGLPANSTDSQQYQLWIIDATRGMQQRISGGIFNASPAAASKPGEIVIPIHAPIHVNKAAAFAITIEKPGGTWVSDMKRRVVIASVNTKG